MGIIIIAILVLMPWGNLTNGHLGLLMLALIVVAIMLGFPTAFTLMGMGVFFAWLAYESVNPHLAVRQVLDLMVQRAYAVMSNDVLIAIPLFVFMGYLVERAALIDRLFKSLHLAMARVPGSLAVATIITCAIFATATGIVGAVVTLMGLLAFPAMLRAGYNIQISAGAVTAGGCLGILIPPSVPLIVYGPTAGVSVVQLYAGSVFHGLMLAVLYLVYVVALAKLKPSLMPPLPEAERRIALPPFAQKLSSRSRNALAGLAGALGGSAGIPGRTALNQFLVSLLPALVIVAMLGLMYQVATAPVVEASPAGLVPAGGAIAADVKEESTGLIGEPPPEESGTGLAEPPAEEAKEGEQPAGAEAPKAEEAKPSAAAAEAKPTEKAAEAERLPIPIWYWI